MAEVDTISIGDSTSSGDYDNLLSKGNVVDEWTERDIFHRVNDEEEEELLKNIETTEIKFLVKTCTVELDDGSEGFVFSSLYEQTGVLQYVCHICDVLLASCKLFNEHISSLEHYSNLQKESHPNGEFPRIVEDTSLELQADELAPPGEEFIIPHTCFIQQKLDGYRTKPLIGLEYLIELVYTNDNEPDYYCLLCHKRGRSDNILNHLTCSTHYHIYLEKFFPTTFDALKKVPKLAACRIGLTVVTTKIIKKIESKFGRLSPKPCFAESFNRNTKLSVLKTIENDESHFREDSGGDYENLVNTEEIMSMQLSDEGEDISQTEKKSILKKSAFRKPWINAKLSEAIQVRLDLYKKWKRSKLDADRNKYKVVRNWLRNELKTRKFNYNQRRTKNESEGETFEGTGKIVESLTTNSDNCEFYILPRLVRPRPPLNIMKYFKMPSTPSCSRSRSSSPRWDTHIRRSRSRSHGSPRRRRSPHPRSRGYRSPSRTSVSSRVVHYRSHRSRSRSRGTSRRRSRSIESRSRSSAHFGYRERDRDRNRDSRSWHPYPPHCRNSRSPSGSPLRYSRV